MVHSYSGQTSFNASKTTVIKNFLRSLDRRHWITVSTQDKARRKSILDYTFREEILTVSLKKDTAIDLDEKIRGNWLMRTNLTEREISGIKIITQEQTQLAQVKKAITQTIVAKKGKEVRDDLREAGDRARDRPGGYAEAPNLGGTAGNGGVRH